MRRWAQLQTGGSGQAEMHPPAQDFCSGVVLVDFDVVADRIGSIQANDASHLQLLVVHNVLHHRKANESDHETHQ